MGEMAVNNAFWVGKNVLVTGHTGFKGSWLCIWLKQLGANVIGYALSPPTEPSLFCKARVSENMVSIIGDIRDAGKLNKVFDSYAPEVVFHLAAQPLVRASYKDPKLTYETNLMGSLNVLESIRCCASVRSVIMVSTDKCYENKEWIWGYRESDRLGGYDPYSSSKACMELMIESYQSSFFDEQDRLSPNTVISSVRAGNVIGGGDWAEDRLIPDIINAILSGSSIDIRSPSAVRPWQHVLEPLSGYLLLAQKQTEQEGGAGQAWNFGPNEQANKTVKWVTQYIVNGLNSSIEISVNNEKTPHEAHFLKLDCTKSNSLLNWSPRWDLPMSLDKLIEWVKADEETDADMHQVCLEQIEAYLSSKELIL